MFRRFVFLGFMLVFCATLLAQELTDKQRNLADRYAQLEQILLRLAETSINSNPLQATLLKKVLIESKDKLLVRRFEILINILERHQLTDAVEGQVEIEKDLLYLLKLLESENRNERRNKEQEKNKEFLKDVEHILHGERILKNQTQQQEAPNLPMLEKKQQQIRLLAQTLQEHITEQEGMSPQSDANESIEQNFSKQEQSQSLQTLQKALERMKQVEQRLWQAKKKEAIEEQEEVIAELQRLKEEFEKILRQLREEELIQTLEKLEERFKRMLRQEQTIRTQTERLLNESANESVSDLRQIKIRMDQLGIDQQVVIEDVERALLLLREDGTAQAMVESLLQARFDMVEVKNRLEQTILDTITIHVEDTVIDALQEMLDAVRTAIEESKQRQSDSDNQQSGNKIAGEPLIQQLAELRMIRSMQRRVNERTKRYDDEIKQMLKKPDADLSLLKQAVEELARQQSRISRILLQIGKTP